MEEREYFLKFDDYMKPWEQYGKFDFDLYMAKQFTNEKSYQNSSNDYQNIKIDKVDL